MNTQLVRVRDLEALWFVLFIGILCLPLDGKSKVKCREHIDYSPSNNNWVYYFRNEIGGISYQKLDSPTIGQIQNIISSRHKTKNENNQL